MDIKDKRIGSAREFEIRDDDRPSDTAYSRDRNISSLPIVLVVAIVVAAVTGYFLLNRPLGVLPGASVPIGTTAR